MRTYRAFTSDTLTVTAPNVRHRSAGAVTSGLVGTVEIRTMVSNGLVAGPVALISNGDNTWYAVIGAPSTAGDYRVVMALAANGANRTFDLELVVIIP